MQHYKLVQDRLQPLGLEVSSLAMDARGGLTATLDGGGELLLGRSELTVRLDRLAAIYRDALRDRRKEFARVDLRYSHGAAIAWRKQQDS